MISFDQVLILEQKVENAVAKIAQLNAENAALRKKCAELTNALSAKTEQFSAFQTDQNRIEEGILKALERLNTVENAVLSAAAQESAQQPESPAHPPVLAQEARPEEAAGTDPSLSNPTEEQSFAEEEIPPQVIEEEEISIPVSNDAHAQEQSQPVDAELFADPAFRQDNTFPFTETPQDEAAGQQPESGSSIQNQFDIF